jgi:hypothetical protein
MLKASFQPSINSVRGRKILTAPFAGTLVRLKIADEPAASIRRLHRRAR